VSTHSKPTMEVDMVFLPNEDLRSKASVLEKEVSATIDMEQPIHPWEIDIERDTFSNPLVSYSSKVLDHFPPFHSMSHVHSSVVFSSWPAVK
jgi:hypothetical protein